MSEPEPPATADLKVYLNHPAPCPYLPDRIEQRLLIPLDERPASAVTQLGFFTQLGFRRSQTILYRPHCPACSACISYRLPVQRFAPSRTQARTQKRNAGLAWQEWSCEEAAAQLYPLFAAYEAARHGDSEMAQFSESDFATLLSADVRAHSNGATCFVLLDGEKPVGAMLIDRIEGGLSAVYSFFDPAQPRRSLGTELVLRLFRQAARERRLYVYLGYWIEDSPKMSYKSHFRPAEILTERGWQELTGSVTLPA